MNTPTPQTASGEMKRQLNRLLEQRRKMKREIERLQADLAAALESLQHMHWCQSCAEGSWEDCEDGRKAEALLAATKKESP